VTWLIFTDVSEDRIGFIFAVKEQAGSNALDRKWQHHSELVKQKPSPDTK
jgi:hypothetical protein